MCEPMWTPESIEIVFYDSEAPIHLQCFVNMYVIGLWPDDMRNILQTFNSSTLSLLPWNQPLATNEWFPFYLFPHGPHHRLHKELTKEWKSCYDCLFIDLFKNKKYILRKTVEFGLGWYCQLEEDDIEGSICMKDDVALTMKVLLYEITAKEYRRYKRKSVSSFYWDEKENKIFLLYWQGSLVNNDDESAATFMNLRDDGLVVKYIFQTIEYTEVLEQNEEEDITISRVVNVSSIEQINEVELDHHAQDSLQETYTFATFEANLMPAINDYYAPLENAEYQHMYRVRIPIDGCQINVSNNKSLKYRKLPNGHQIFFDYNFAEVV